MKITQLILKNFVGNITCNRLVNAFESIDFETPELMPIDDHNNKTNTLYNSTRSHNLQYVYFSGLASKDYNKRIQELLFETTGLHFGGAINNLCTPLFKYNNLGVIKPHRDVDKTLFTPRYPNFIALTMLTQRGVDFEGGRFYINYKAEVSDDGKTVTNDLPKDRYYPNLNKGDVFIFDNTCTVHGVEKTIVKPHQKGRYTASIRTK